MFHSLLHHQHVLAYVEERHQSGIQRTQHPRPTHPRVRPGRLRRATAVTLLRLAERLAQQPIATQPRRT